MDMNTKDYEYYKAVDKEDNEYLWRMSKASQLWFSQKKEGSYNDADWEKSSGLGPMFGEFVISRDPKIESFVALTEEEIFLEIL